MIKTVMIGKRARKQLRRVPRHIVEALAAWATSVSDKGLEEVRKIPGYHDEPLSGDRAGQRSVRLSRAWRAFYVVIDGEVRAVEVVEVNPHRY